MTQDVENNVQSAAADIIPAEKENLLQQIEALNKTNALLTFQLEEAQRKIVWFEEQFKLYRQRQFGKSSETSVALQLELIFNADEQGSAQSPEAAAEEKTELIGTARRKSVGRKIDTSQLPRQKKLHDLVAHEKICKDCGHELHKIRDDIAEQIEVIPKQLYVIEHIYPQYGCRHCQTVISAEKSPAPIPKALAGASLLTETVINKYENHLPLYRQSQMWKSMHIDIPDNTLGNWVMQGGETLRSMDEALCQEMVTASYLQVDETPVQVLSSGKQGYMWVYLSLLPDRQLVRFRFDMGRSRRVVETDLEAFKGLLQSDGYGGYNGIRQKKAVIGFGCVSHARRKFTDVVKALPESTTNSKAHESLQYFAMLYAVEKKAREQKLSFVERKSLRQKEAAPILEKFHQWLLETQKQIPPQSKVGMAVEYSLKQWPFLTRYVHYGEVEIDTNWVENEIRPFALGRRNWLFTGNEGSAQIAAIWYSLIQSAKWNELNPRIYIHYLLTQVHDLRKGHIDPRDLLPHRIDHQKLQQFADQEFQKARSLYASFTNTC